LAAAFPAETTHLNTFTGLWPVVACKQNKQHSQEDEPMQQVTKQKDDKKGK
jgi:hypothetical protein